jgi:integrase
MRQLVDRGVDPIEHLRTLKRAPLASAHEDTFREAAKRYFKARKEKWKNKKHTDTWMASLVKYAKPILDKPVAQIDTGDILACLEPQWAKHPETLSRVRQRIEAVIGSEYVRQGIDKLNPARWRDHLERPLTSRADVRKVKHLAALPFAELPAFVGELRQHGGFWSMDLQFQILTAARPGEASGARWNEIDLDAARWVIPAARMKGGRRHTVPLSAQAVALLRTIPRLAGNRAFVFPSHIAGQSISPEGKRHKLQKMRAGVTSHGFRSSFKDWARSKTSYADEVSELALAHVSTDATRAAYARDELIDLRAGLMQAWADYCDGKPGDAE